MAENSLYAYVRRGLGHKWDVQKHNDLTPGIPDLSLHEHGALGTVWVECKALAGWPARPATPVRLTEFTELQALWLRRRRGYLFVRVGRDYFLFLGADAWRMWEADGWTRAQWYELAWRYWRGRVLWGEFAEAVRI